MDCKVVHELRFVPMPLSDIAEFVRYRLLIFYCITRIKSRSKLTVEVIATRGPQSSLLFFLAVIHHPYVVGRGSIHAHNA